MGIVEGSKDAEYGAPIFYILHEGAIRFWDGLTQVIPDRWDGLVLKLKTFEGEEVDEIRQGAFDVLAPIQLTKNAGWPLWGAPRFGRN